MEIYEVKLLIKTSYRPYKWNWNEILDLESGEKVCVISIDETNEDCLCENESLKTEEEIQS